MRKGTSAGPVKWEFPSDLVSEGRSLEDFEDCAMR
jgi:hypothetical protein